MDPIVVEFDLEASPAHAFEVWTSRPSMWWPRSHTITQDPDLTVVFEPFPGGRIYERGRDGSEHEWGEMKGVIELQEFPWWQKDFEGFLGAKSLWEWENQFWLKKAGYLS